MSRPLRPGDLVSMRPAGKRGYGLGHVVAVGPVNARIKPCARGPEQTLPMGDVVLTGGQLWLDEHPEHSDAVQTGFHLGAA